MNIVTPNVTIISSTTLHQDAMTWDAEERNEIIAGAMIYQGGSSEAEAVLEYAGRECYDSHDRPNPATATTQTYLQRTLFDQAHWSIAEHASATLHITGVSRAFLTELTRHRHLSFSVRSQRFVDESDCNVVMPPAIRDAEDPSIRTAWRYDMAEEVSNYTDHVHLLDHLPRKQAREAARSVLPNAVETRMVVSANLRAWHNVIALRTAPGVDAEMREVMSLVRDQLATIAPTIFKEQA